MLILAPNTNILNMDTSAFNIFDLVIPKVEAQSYDGISQPTYGLLDIADAENQAELNFSTDSLTPGVGETFTVDVEIATKDFTINEYQVVVDFDTTKLSVLDVEPDTAGTQIEFLDLVFVAEVGDNNVQDGRITLIARTPSGSALSVNRAVARITFQSQEQGVTVIEPVSTFEGTKLINQNGVVIDASLNSLTLNIGSAKTSSSSKTSSKTSTINSATSSATSSATPPEQIPNTGIFDEGLAIIPVVLGLLLVLVGARLQIEAKKARKR